MAGRLTETRPDTQASSVPSSESSRAPSQPPEERDLDWEDYNYLQDLAAGGGQQGDLENLLNLLAALLAGIPDLNTAELETLLRDLPVPDDTSQPGHDYGGGSGGE